MKHIKTYENNTEPLYKEGDYVELGEEAIKDNGLSDIYENIGVIVDVRRSLSTMYNVDYLRDDFEFENITQNFVYEVEIVRKLSQEIGRAHV